MMREQCLRSIALGLTLAAILVAAPARADRGDRDEFERSWSVDPDARIDVEIVNGRIEVRGWEKNEVRVEARGAGADRLEVDASAGWVSIRVQHGFGMLPWHFGKTEVDLELRVPFGSRIEAKTINGPIRARDVRGTVSFYSVNGKIEVEGSPREIDLETVSEDIEFRGESRGGGSSAIAKTISGSIELRGVSGEVDVSTISGSIEVRGSQFERVQLGSVSGSIELVGSLAAGARVRAKSHSGSVKLRLPADTSARFDAESFSGSIDNDFGPDGRQTSKFSPGRRLNFETGDGDARVSVDTFSGSIRIDRSESDD